MQTQTTDSKSPFYQWCVVELIGNQRIVGHCTEETIAGTAMLRVDVPGKDGATKFTRYYGNAAIYAIIPIGKEMAIALAQQTHSEPVHRYELPQLEAAKTVASEPAIAGCDDDEKDGDS